MGLSGSAVFATTVTDEHDLDVLLEGVRIGDLGRGNAAAAEDADVGELVEVSQGDGARLHAAHGEPGHGPVRLIWEGAEVGVNERNQIFNEHSRERIEVELRPPGSGMLRDSGLSASPGTRSTPVEPPGT